MKFAYVRLICTRLRREWDRVLNLLLISTYAAYSLISVPIPVLRLVNTNPFWINLLMAILLIGCAVGVVSISVNRLLLTRLAAFLILGGLGLQIVISILADGLTPGDFLVSALFTSFLSLKRRIQWKNDTVREINEIQAIVDETMQSIQKEVDGKGRDQ